MKVSDVAFDLGRRGQLSSALLQLVLCILSRSHELILSLAQFQDSWREGLIGQVAVLQSVIESIQPAAHIGQFRVNRSELGSQFFSQRVDLFGHELNQLRDDLLVQNPLLHIGNDEILDAARVEVAAVAGARSLSMQRVADVVGELSALGSVSHVLFATATAMKQPAEQELAARPSRLLDFGRPRSKPGLHRGEDFTRDQRGPVALGANRFGDLR